MALIGALKATRATDIVRLAGAALFIIIVAALIDLLVRPTTACWWYGALTVAAFYAISMAVSGSYNPLYLAMGADNVMSVSKFQFLVWNAAVVFSYVWIYAVRYSHGYAEPLSRDSGLPHNVLIAMGVSIASFAAAKGITVSYLAAGRISKPAADKPNDNVVNLVAEDGQPDLVKIQMLVWTLIAVGIFIAATIHAVATNTDPKTLQLPNIDASLMVLMGLGQAAYIGNKLTSSDVPVLSSVSPLPLTAGSTVTITGSNLKGLVTASFGTTQANPVSNGSDTSVQVVVPAGAAGALSVNVDGLQSANALPV